MTFRCINLFLPCPFEFSTTILIIIWLLWCRLVSFSFLSVLPSPLSLQYPSTNLSPDPRIKWESMKGFTIPTPTLDHIGLLFCLTVVNGVKYQSDMYFVHRPGRLTRASLPLALQTRVSVVNSVHLNFSVFLPSEQDHERVPKQQRNHPGPEGGAAGAELHRHGQAEHKGQYHLELSRKGGTCYKQHTYIFQIDIRTDSERCVVDF